MILPFVLDFLFLPSCVSCGRITNNFILKNETNKWVCDKCYERVIKYKNGQILNVTEELVSKFKLLQPGNCLAFGSAFKMPLQLKLDMPDPTPLSQNIDMSTCWY